MNCRILIGLQFALGKSLDITSFSRACAPKATTTDPDLTPIGDQLGSLVPSEEYIDRAPYGTAEALGFHGIDHA